MTDDFSNELINFMKHMSQRSLGDYHHCARQSGLTMLQINVLMRLYCHGSIEISGLSDTIMGNKAAASQMVERLVQLGLVERIDDPGDRRVKKVQLTEKGRQVIDEGNTFSQGWVDEMAARLNDDQKQSIAQAIHILNELTPQTMPAKKCEK